MWYQFLNKGENQLVWGWGIKACGFPGTLDDSVTVGYGYLGPYYTLESCCHLEMVYSGLKTPALCGIWTPEIDFIRGDRLEGDLTQEMEA